MPELDLHNTSLPSESQIKKSGFNQFMSRLFGWSRSSKSSRALSFSKVDVQGNERVGQALLNQKFNLQGPISEKLDQLFNLWLSDNTDKFTELQDRFARLQQLQYNYYNDPYINRTVALYADEATQLDDQDVLISIETPDPRMTRSMYELLNRWGVTPSRVRAVFEQLAIYGDAFWSNKITEFGVEKITPLQQLQVTDRIEFNPMKVLEMKKRRTGFFGTAASNNYLINQMISQLEQTGDFADLFDTKLFGFNIDNDLSVPAWAITHFRVNADGGEFYPWGTSPILGALSSSKLMQSTIALQSLARQMNFPITLYKVKTSDEMDEARQFAVVDRVREAYDNIGVNPAQGSSEIYTNNTKIWLPDGLVSVEVVKPDIDISKTDDMELYQNREAVSLGLPKAFFSGDAGWYGVNHSGKALMQQYKPFARRVYSLQSAFLEGLSDLFRLHFAITGEYDFRVPFTLSMKYPAVDVDEEINTSRKSSLEMASNVIGLVKGIIGAGDEDTLPPDIARDIVTKYTFLDPSDIMKWTRDAKYRISTAPVSAQDEEAEEGLEDTEPLNLDVPVEESKHSSDSLKEQKFKELYDLKKEGIYFKVLKENAIGDFVRNCRHVHTSTIIPSCNTLMLETLNNESAKNNSSRLKESFAAEKVSKKKKKTT